MVIGKAKRLKGAKAPLPSPSVVSVDVGSTGPGGDAYLCSHGYKGIFICFYISVLP